jgi:hypothetical protein
MSIEFDGLDEALHRSIGFPELLLKQLDSQCSIREI